jgi:hypothetical protein
MSIIEKLKNLNLKGETSVTLTYSDGTDVFVHNETAVDTAIAETDVISQFSDLIATPGLNALDAYGNNILNELRNEGYLEDYAHDFTFADYLTDTITENFYDVEFIEKSVQQYDYKRGYCTLETTVQVPFGNFIEAQPYVGGWTIAVQTENGILTLN